MPNLRNSQTFPKWLHHVTSYQQCARVLLFPHTPHQHLLLPFNDSHSSRCEIYFIMVFICSSLMTMMLNLFSVYLYWWNVCLHLLIIFLYLLQRKCTLRGDRNNILYFIQLQMPPWNIVRWFTYWWLKCPKGWSWFHRWHVKKVSCSISYVHKLICP